MITRIVKMVFRLEATSEFLENFDKVKSQIRGSEGCEYLELFQDVSDERIFFTYSQWQSTEHLNQYRGSQLFKDTWEFTKARFDDRPQAWSIKSLRKLT